jgi:hypothetical protein
MSRIIAVDANNDLYIGPDGSLALAYNLQAVMQAAQHAAQTQLGEMLYAVDQGLPNFATVWNGATNISQFEAYLRRVLLAVNHVTGVRDLSIVAVGNTLSYRATIETEYGPGVLNG